MIKFTAPCAELTVGPPIYLLESVNVCYRCKKKAKVIALATPESAEDDLTTFHNIIALPDALLWEIHRWHPLFERRYSKQAEETYFMNLCPKCGAHLGDWFMHCEPGGAFSPTSEQEAARITIRALRVEGLITLTCSRSTGDGELIYANARRV